MCGEEVSVAGRRLRQPVDLFLERDDLLAGLFQRADESLVLVDDTGEVGLRLGQSFLELSNLARWGGGRGSRHRGFFFEEGRLGREVLPFLLASCASLGVVTCGHVSPPPARRRPYRTPPPPCSAAYPRRRDARGRTAAFHPSRRIRPVVSLFGARSLGRTTPPGRC